MDVPIAISDALRWVFLTMVSRYLECGGWICQETLWDRSLVTFDVRQCGGKYG